MISMYAGFACLYVVVTALGIAVLYSCWEFGCALIKFNGMRGLRAVALFIIAFYASCFIMPLFLTAYVRIIQL
ncbi:hypothetical protein pEaSNUABM11_00153 [Erwinia phage pEa_SNUABM_11]|nr:hypothetical protein pEaSNUABM11_00153 [Erwinia phage pEa_SNUABM_11]